MVSRYLRLVLLWTGDTTHSSARGLRRHMCSKWLSREKGCLSQSKWKRLLRWVSFLVPESPFFRHAQIALLVRGFLGNCYHCIYFFHVYFIFHFLRYCFFFSFLFNPTVSRSRNLMPCRRWDVKEWIQKDCERNLLFVCKNHCLVSNKIYTVDKANIVYSLKFTDVYLLYLLRWFKKEIQVSEQTCKVNPLFSM